MIQLFYLITVPVLATIKVIIQGVFAKDRTKSVADIMLLNTMIFISCFIVLCALFLRGKIPTYAIIWGMLYGIFTVLFQGVYATAFSCGSVGLTVVINNFYIAIPMLFGIFYYNEFPKLVNYVGMALLIIPFILIPKQGDKKINIKWLICAVSAMLLSAMHNIVIMFYTKQYASFSDKSYVVLMGYFFASLFGLFYTFVISKEKPTMKVDKKLIFGIALIGISLGIHNVLNVKAIAEVNATIYFPVTTVLTLTYTMILDKLIYKTHLSIMQKIGVTFGIISLVLLNL